MLGIRLELFVGPSLPTPLAPELLEAVEQVSVTHQDEGRSGFQISFVASRDRKTGREGFPPLLDFTFKIGNRLQIVARVGARTHVLMDGIITNHQLSPGAEANATRFTITGEDLSVLLDLVELKVTFPGMSEWMIAGTLLAALAPFGVVPTVIPDPTPDFPLPTDELPQMSGTFHGMLNQLAQKWSYVFYVSPGPVRGMSQAYWGPPIRAGIPQKALTWRMGAASNLGSIQFQSDGTKPKFVYGLLKENETGAPAIPIIGLPFTGQPMSALPAYVGNLPFVGTKLMETDEGGKVMDALWKATAEVFKASKAAVTATGELDVARYGDVLSARSLVDVRGVGRTMDGSWYVQSTTHSISRGSWSQSFNLEREGTLSLSQRVATA